MVIVLIVSFILPELYNDLDIEFNYLPRLVFANVIVLLLSLANFSYFYYLIRKEKRSEVVNKPLLRSILIIGVPLLFLIIVLFFLLSLPLYTLEMSV